MSSNFAFLLARHPALHDEATEAERLANTSPRASCFQSRVTLELAVQWLYAHDASLRRPLDERLGALVHEPSFRAALPAPLFQKVRAVLLAGNEAAHRSPKVGVRESLRAVEDLFHVLFWLSQVYSPDAAAHPHVTFDRSLLPTGEVREIVDTRLAELEQRHAARLAALHAEAEGQVATLQAELAALKAKNAAVPDGHDYNEAATRDFFIDRLLTEAGWPLDQDGVHTEHPVTGMPNEAGQGFVDYVLWGDDDVPLGLVEAKRTRHSVMKGQQQAKLYADCLQATYGRRPVIYLTNGYEHRFWDDAAGGPREVASFHTKDELQRLIHRRTAALPTGGLVIDGTIVLCGNIEYFGEDVKEEDAPPVVSLAERLVRRRADLLGLLGGSDPELRTSLVDRLHAHVAGTNPQSFLVRKKRERVEPLRDRAAWSDKTDKEIAEAVDAIADLPSTAGTEDHLTARQLDALAPRLQIGLLRPDDRFECAQEELRRVAEGLLAKANTLPMVAKERPLLERILQDVYWENLTVRRIEETRLALRELARYVDRREGESHRVNFTDTRGEAKDVPVLGLQAAVDLALYRRKVEAFIRAH